MPITIDGYNINRIYNNNAISAYVQTGVQGNRKIIALLAIGNPTNITITRVYYNNGASGIDLIPIFNSNAFLHGDMYIRMAGYYLDRAPANKLCSIVSTLSGYAEFAYLGVYGLSNAKPSSVAYYNWVHADVSSSVYMSGITPATSDSLHLSLVGGYGAEPMPPTASYGLIKDDGDSPWTSCGAIAHEFRTNTTPDDIFWSTMGDINIAVTSCVNVSYQLSSGIYQRCLPNLG